MLNNKIILITGGTGSLGKKLTHYLLKNFTQVKRVIIFSRDELKQYEMSLQFSKTDLKKLRFFLGDIRDLSRVTYAFKNVDYVIHAAALKQVNTAEYNPFEFIKTNILGSQNIIEAALNSKVSKVMALSTDKAAAPINLYGASKLCSDKLFTAANNYIGSEKKVFSVIRYGNVFGSRGSIVPTFINYNLNSKYLPLTDPKMTRFSLSIDEAVKFVIKCLFKGIGGEIFVPKIKSYKLIDLAKSLNKNKKIKIIGVRPGEKIHEELITRGDSSTTYDQGDYYVILPPQLEQKYYKKKYKIFNKKNKVPSNFSYNSFNNKKFLSISEIKKQIEIFKENNE